MCIILCIVSRALQLEITCVPQGSALQKKLNPRAKIAKGTVREVPKVTQGSGATPHPFETWGMYTQPSPSDTHSMLQEKKTFTRDSVVRYWLLKRYLDTQADSAAGAQPDHRGCRLGVDHGGAAAQPAHASHCNCRSARHHMFC